jgi:hypothetical protein
VPAGQDALADVLAAAAAPATQGELVGEQAALAAFRAASLGPAPKPRRRSMVSSTLAKLLSAKVAAVGAAIALGGVAVAAGTGHLPEVLPGGTTGRTTATVPSAGASPSASVGHGGRGSGVGAGSEATDPARLVGLCRAYGRGTGEGAAAAAADPAFSVLVREAGDRSRVVDYCAGLLLRSGADGPTASVAASATADHGKGQAKDHPGGGTPTSGGGHGGGRPSTHPTPHGSGRPGSAPDGRTAHVVGQPAN